MFYFEEVQNIHSYAKAEELRASDLTAAKREAARKSVFYGTVLIVGNSTQNGYIDYVVAYRDERGKWHNEEYDRAVPTN